ncbi:MULTISPECIES: HpcH/HpaI aldolase/citrate lyase family protein [Paenibacillus]|uniref:HpcH/HpaI aldolase/citrate lyase family protein n=1 Tax=Paenibacillus TaxID=44249 RepID=UPI001E322C5C|nr:MULTISPECIES: HpcH/HpaI aldolase/citrate lyase family protein [Paenibacillus]MDH6429428.1 citrate lyase beta subunit [Paenibacillus sp. PastH-4]MDH6445636.1 citrate lyase beta subunit [Paenibacillus sp. PastF-4]MDH6529523.1 citrate lyase beta subunit [Paenibacillus sp. PastH-3]
MRYFDYLTKEQEISLFYTPPISFDHTTNKELLAYAVGAALYMPATRASVAEDIIKLKNAGLVTVIIDLEDAIGDDQVDNAEESIIQHLIYLAAYAENELDSSNSLPLLFIRVRNPDQLRQMIFRLGSLVTMLTGFVFPKFSVDNGIQYFETLAEYNNTRGYNDPVLYGMPILETAPIIYRESRVDSLLSIRDLLRNYRELVLNVRIGATDFSSLFGLRRSPDVSIYDLTPIRDCISDIINVFGRVEEGYVISGPVWEYFANKGHRVLRPQLRQTPFEDTYGKNGRDMRNSYISSSVDGLIREVILDKENGIVGKTIIHPSHLRPVQAMYTVMHEEYVDALSIVESNDGSLGVFKSQYFNKMNEIKPHLNWARRILLRSQIYGVLHEQQHFVGLLPENEFTHV